MKVVTLEQSSRTFEQMFWHSEGCVMTAKILQIAITSTLELAVLQEAHAPCETSSTS
jgi:hypothetical protein